MAKYTWSNIQQLEDSIASGRFAAEALTAIPGLATLSMAARRDAVLAELLAATPENVVVAPIGDGVTDQTVVLQAAISSMGAGQTLALTGTYLLSAAIIPTVDNVLIDGPATLMAKAGVQFEYVWLGTSRTGVRVRNITFDANKTNRSSGQTIRFMGAAFITSTDCIFENCTAKNVRGLTGSAVGLYLGGCTRCRIIAPLLLDCGDAAPNSADGVFMSGDENECTDPICIRCTDTGVVIESANHSVIRNVIAFDCSSPCAISNANALDKRGNMILGVTSRCNLQGGTGHVFIGVPSTDVGHLLDSVVSDLTLYTPAGTPGSGGPAVNVAQGGFGRVKGLTLAHVRINGGLTQGVNIDGDDVRLSDVRVAGITGAGTSGYRVATGSLRCEIVDSEATGTANGLVAIGTADVRSRSNIFRDNTAWGVYAFDTSTIRSEMDTVLNPTTGYFGKDGGATLQQVGVRDGHLWFNPTGTFDLGYVGAVPRDVLFSRDLDGAGGFRQAVSGWYQTNIPAAQAATEATRGDGRFLAPSAGSVLGIQVALDPSQARSAGTLTAEVWVATINPTTGARTETATGLTAVLDGTNLVKKTTTQAKDLTLFAAGDEVFVKFTTDGSWAPTTADPRCTVFLEC